MSHYRTFDGMCWPAPGTHMNELEWSLRYDRERMTPGQLLTVASVLSAYTELVKMPAARRNAIIKQLRLGPNLPRTGSAEKSSATSGSGVSVEAREQSSGMAGA